MHYSGGLMVFENRAKPISIVDVTDLKRPPFHCSSLSSRQIVVGDGEIASSG